MRKTLLSTLAVAVLLGASSLAPAQDAPKTLATASISGYDDVVEKLGIIGQIAGNPDVVKMLEGMIQGATQGKGLAGLDKTKPWGAVVLADFDAPEPPVVIFLPVTDLDKLLDALSGTLGPADDAGDGVKKVEPPGGEAMFIKPQGSWAFVSNKAENLSAAPADPMKTLKGLNEKYIVAVSISVKNVPDEQRDEMRRNLEQGAQALGQPMPGESPEDFAIRAGMTKRMINEFATALNDLDEVVIGWAVDAQSKSTYLDFEITAVEGSKTAGVFNEPQPGKTDYAGFDLPGAAVTANWASSLSDRDVADLKKTLATIRAKATKELESQDLPDTDRQTAERLLGDLIDMLTTTAEKKLVDGGLVLMLESESVAGAVGGAIGDGDKLEKVIKKLVDLAVQENPDIKPLVKLNAQTHEGVRFHTLAVPLPDEQAKEFFGEALEVVVGINDTSLYLAFGRDAAGVLKQVIDKSTAEKGKAIPPFKLSISLTPVVGFAADVVEDPATGMMIGMLAGMLKQAGSQDHVTLTSKQITNGVSVRLEFEEGILKAIGAAAQMGGGGMGGGGMGGGAMPGGPMPPGNAPF